MPLSSTHKKIQDSLYWIYAFSSLLISFQKLKPTTLNSLENTCNLQLSFQTHPDLVNYKFRLNFPMKGCEVALQGYLTFMWALTHNYMCISKFSVYTCKPNISLQRGVGTFDRGLTPAGYTALLCHCGHCRVSLSKVTHQTGKAGILIQKKKKLKLKFMR